jgi:hypothetical protein
LDNEIDKAKATRSMLSKLMLRGPTLDITEVGSVDAGPLSELLLSPAQLFAAGLERKAEALADVRRGPRPHIG